LHERSEVIPESGIWQWLAAGVAALLIGLSKTGIPGIGILAVTLLATAMPAKTSVGVMLPLLIVGDVFAVAYYHGKAQWKYLRRVLAPAAVGLIVGYLAMGAVSDAALKRVIGAMAIGLLTMQFLRDRGVFADERIPHHWLFAWSLGTVAGIVTMMSNAAGPIMIVYFLAMGLDRFEFIGTLAWYFLLLNCAKTPFFVDLGMIGRDTILFDLKLTPLLLAGAAAGLLAPRRIPERPFRYVVMILAAAAAAKLLAFG
jgi:uncharacterized membrane protein YfcA